MVANIYDKLRTKADFDRLEEEFQARKRAKRQSFELGEQSIETNRLQQELLQKKVDNPLMAGSGSIPAPLQLANAYLEAKQSGNIERANAIETFAKTQEKGIMQNQQGRYIPKHGIVDALGDLQYGKQSGSERAKTAFEPQRKADIAQQVSDVNLVMQPKIEYEKQVSSLKGKSMGEDIVSFDSLVAAYPALTDATDRLKDLAKVATYTKAGRSVDWIKRQSGLNVGTPAEAAASMANIVSVEILPQLKPTFGAAFTVEEGNWLKSTMGDLNSSPEEKLAQINARVRGWNNQLKTLSRSTGKKIPDRLLQNSEDAFYKNRQKSIPQVKFLGFE